MGHDFGFAYYDDTHLVCTQCGTIAIFFVRSTQQESRRSWCMRMRFIHLWIYGE